jgi:(S)-ureidoglycine aminohydrolase
MKNILSFLFTFYTLQCAAQVESKVYSFDNTAALKNKGLEQKVFFDGPTSDFSQMSMEAFTGPKKLKMTIQEELSETLVIVKGGEIAFKLNGQSKTMRPGSIALLMPNDKLTLMSSSPGSSIYIMKYINKEDNSIARGNEYGGSFLKDWDEIPYKTHDKGGIRNFYNLPTANCKRIEMHVTNLNTGLKSHEPHTHKAAEIILMIKGKTEMELGDNIYHGKTGDFYFLGSNIPHAIKNIDSEQIQYFAYQFE